MMEEFKGTPGKWGIYHGSASDSTTACIEITSTESVHEVAYLQSTPSNIGSYEPTSFDRTIANAHLISAAPDLLKALQLSVSVIKNMAGPSQSKTFALEMAASAVSKALGK